MVVVLRLDIRLTGRNETDARSARVAVDERARRRRRRNDDENREQNQRRHLSQRCWRRERNVK